MAGFGEPSTNGDGLVVIRVRCDHELHTQRLRLVPGVDADLARKQSPLRIVELYEVGLDYQLSGCVIKVGNARLLVQLSRGTSEKQVQQSEQGRLAHVVGTNNDCVPPDVDLEILDPTVVRDLDPTQSHDLGRSLRREQFRLLKHQLDSLLLEVWRIVILRQQTTDLGSHRRPDRLLEVPVDRGA
jgi:hypothetical protein